MDLGYENRHELEVASRQVVAGMTDWEYVDEARFANLKFPRATFFNGRESSRGPEQTPSCYNPCGSSIRLRILSDSVLARVMVRN